MAKLPREVNFLLDKLFDEDIETLRPGRKLRLGDLLLYGYDAKWKKKLPYWDSLPLMMIMDQDSTYVQGINFHYIPYTWRVKLAKDIWGKGWKPKYKDIKQAVGKIPRGYLVLAWRKYIIKNIQTNIKVFDEETYLPAIQNVMPQFEKASAEEVMKDINRLYKDSKRR